MSLQPRIATPTEKVGQRLADCGMLLGVVQHRVLLIARECVGISRLGPLPSLALVTCDPARASPSQPELDYA